MDKTTFERVLGAVKYKREFAREFQVYSGTIDSILEERDGGIASVVLAVEGDQNKVQLRLGADSYEVTDGLYEKGKTLTGLFDPGREGIKGEPLLRKNCQPGDKVTVVCWKMDQEMGTGQSYLPVRAFGNYTQDSFRSSAELLRYLGLSKHPCYASTNVDMRPCFSLYLSRTFSPYKGA